MKKVAPAEGNAKARRAFAVRSPRSYVTEALVVAYRARRESPEDAAVVDVLSALRVALDPASGEPLLESPALAWARGVLQKHPNATRAEARRAVMVRALLTIAQVYADAGDAAFHAAVLLGREDLAPHPNDRSPRALERAIGDARARGKDDELVVKAMLRATGMGENEAANAVKSAVSSKQ